MFVQLSDGCRLELAGRNAEALGKLLMEVHIRIGKADDKKRRARIGLGLTDCDNLPAHARFGGRLNQSGAYTHALTDCKITHYICLILYMLLSALSRAEGIVSKNRQPPTDTCPGNFGPTLSGSSSNWARAHRERALSCLPCSAVR